MSAGRTLRAGLVQLNAGDDPAVNLPETERLVREAARGGAALVLTPEVTNCVSASRTHQRRTLTWEGRDPTLARLRDLALELGVWICAGSLALRAEDDETRFANRQVVIGPDGAVAARYDKIHMFDVELGGEESYRESDGFRPGHRAVTAQAAGARLGLTICYDLRFPALYRALAEAGAEVLTAPAAFTVPTGRAHWETLVRARAIETGCFVLAPAQVGRHAAGRGRSRETWGHTLAVDPWGAVLADAGGDGPCAVTVDLDLDAVAAARTRVPSLANARAFAPPA